jgi:hypothetical protein
MQGHGDNTIAKNDLEGTWKGEVMASFVAVPRPEKNSVKQKNLPQ